MVVSWNRLYFFAGLPGEEHMELFRPEYIGNEPDIPQNELYMEIYFHIW